MRGYCTVHGTALVTDLNGIPTCLECRREATQETRDPLARSLVYQRILGSLDTQEPQRTS